MAPKAIQALDALGRVLGLPPLALPAPTKDPLKTSTAAARTTLAGSAEAPAPPSAHFQIGPANSIAAMTKSAGSKTCRLTTSRTARSTFSRSDTIQIENEFSTRTTVCSGPFKAPDDGRAQIADGWTLERTLALDASIGQRPRPLVSLGNARLPAHLRRPRPRSETGAIRVRREKAALSGGCKSYPANAPAGSNRSSHGGDEPAWARRAVDEGVRSCPRAGCRKSARPVR